MAARYRLSLLPKPTQQGERQFGRSLVLIHSSHSLIYQGLHCNLAEASSAGGHTETNNSNFTTVPAAAKSRRAWEEYNFLADLTRSIKLMVLVLGSGDRQWQERAAGQSAFSVFSWVGGKIIDNHFRFGSSVKIQISKMNHDDGKRSLFAHEIPGRTRNSKYKKCLQRFSGGSWENF